MLVLGITGHPGSGKDTVADYISTKGFFKISGSDVIRQKMRELGLSTERANMYVFIKERRRQYGNAYPSEEIMNKLTEDTVLAGFRNREEVKLFRDRLGKDFILIAVDTSLQIRYERAKQRKRIGDDISFEQFKMDEEKERAAESGSHEVDFVMTMADHAIANDGTLEELHQKIDQILAELPLRRGD